jgi:hypothetical protein
MTTCIILAEETHNEHQDNRKTVIIKISQNSVFVILTEENHDKIYYYRGTVLTDI